MIDKETYGLEVEAKTSKAKKAFSDLANFIRNFGKKAEEEATLQPKIDPSISKKELFKWREDLQNSIKETKLDVKNYKDTPTGHYYEEDLKRYQEGLELVDNRIKEIEEDEAKANEELEEMGNQGEKSTSILSGLFDKSIGKIKRFTYYLLGARSVFSLFMKYQSIYYQYNEQMQYQSELSQNAIALSLAPAFEFLGNVIAYASIAFAKFIELLTGVNVLSKVSTKGIRDYNKALKESQTLLSGIDEITNLSLPSSTGLAGQYKALDEFQKKVAEVTEWFNKNKWIQSIADGIRSIFDYVNDHWDVFKYIFGAVAIGTIGIKIGLGLVGLAATLGLTGLMSTLATIAGYAGLAIAISVVVEESVTLFKLLKDLRETKQLQDELNKNAKKDAQEQVLALQQEISELETLQEGTKEYDDKIKTINSRLDSMLLYIENGREEYDDYIPTIQNVGKKLTEITGKNYTAKINLAVKTGQAEKDSNSFLSKFKTNLSIVWNNFTKGFKNTSYIQILGRALHLPGYAKGLDYVPYDNYPALLHKGETVVPAKYNPQIHSVGNEYTNSLLEELVIKMDDLSRRPNVFEIDGQQFANATYGLYEDANNRQGYVKEVVR